MGRTLCWSSRRRTLFEDRLRWVIPIEGEVRSGEIIGRPGDCLL